MKLHPAASGNIPWFIAEPGATDALMAAVGAFLLVAVLLFGILFFRLHSLPERLAHRSRKIQVEIVAVLCLLALFTHVHLFWVAALLLALIDIPDFGSAFGRMAVSLEKISGQLPVRENHSDVYEAATLVPGTAGADAEAGKKRTHA
jgi:hypothetical protein